MIIQVFKISTMELWTVKNKHELALLIHKETGIIVPHQWTISKLIKYLPVDNYHVVTPLERRNNI